VKQKRFLQEDSEGKIPEFWNEYFATRQHEKVHGYLGVCAQLKEKSEEFNYGIGANAEQMEEIPEGFDEFSGCDTLKSI